MKNKNLVCLLAPLRSGETSSHQIDPSAAKTPKAVVTPAATSSSPTATSDSVPAAVVPVPPPPRPSQAQGWDR